MVALRSMKLEERARLCIEAKHDDLLKQMERPERKCDSTGKAFDPPSLTFYRVLTTYLYQFWLFSFTTAKYWGYGPTDWTANRLEFDRYKDTDRGAHSSADKPMTNAETPLSSATPSIEDNDLNREQLTESPPSACRWTINAAIRTRYEGDEEDQVMTRIQK